MKEYVLKNILVPIDFSTFSRYALHHAERIGELTHARITLLHVVEPFIDVWGANAGMIGSAMGLVRDLHIRGSNELKRISKATLKRTGVQVRTIATIGRIAPTIRKKALETRSDLIVMGTHGASGFVENLIGSNTYQVATLSSVPVLSVHRTMGRHGYSHIVYPVRSNVRPMEKFSHALMFAKLFKAQVHVVGLLQPGTKTTQTAMRTLCATITRRFAREGVETKQALTSHQHIADAVIRYAQHYPGSLVVINRDHDFRLVEVFQGTFSKRILHKILRPVLSVP